MNISKKKRNVVVQTIFDDGHSQWNAFSHDKRLENRQHIAIHHDQRHQVYESPQSNPRSKNECPSIISFWK